LRNFHVPLSDELYKQLRAEAERSQQAATALARDAIAWWLQQRQKAALDESIRAYAAQGAGTPADVDQALEAASVDHLLDAEEDL
jgi:predicted transcriptional regulator